MGIEIKKISNFASISAFALMAMAPKIAYSQTIDPAVQDAIDNAVELEANDRQDADEALEGRIDTLETTVGDATSGLVKDVAALNVHAANSDEEDIRQNQRMDSIDDVTDALAVRADNLEATVNNEETGVLALNERLHAEALTRADHDQLLSVRITEEANTRAAADTTLANSAADPLGGGAAYWTCNGFVPVT